MEQNNMPELLHHTNVLDTSEIRQASTTEMPVILLCGAGQLALEVAKLSAQANFAVDVVDTDAEKASEDLFPMARSLFAVPEFDDLTLHCDIGPRHYIAILTHETRHSQTILQQVLHTQARYIGMIGSREQRAPVFAALREQGMPTTELACVRCPIGLSIGAQSPQERAIAIIAECIAAREGCLPRAVPPKDA